eukprot:TRINITY_DN356_c0_g1_i1.p1 TRINITY_DN356_c0_g1~~TRINITY_DN356_c0_g1_i1.p1  ORF type:complete len:391 (+),score=100.20 TRINITY_DN356_c0_g1_i1:49-1221(+)
MNRIMLGRRVTRVARYASTTGEKESGEKKEQKQQQQPKAAVSGTEDKKIATTAAGPAEGADTKVGILNQVMASLMKPDVRAAYECSLMPPERQHEFLQHVRETDLAHRKHEIEKIKEDWSAEIALAKVKAKAAIDEMKQKAGENEELNAADHLRYLEVLAKKIEKEKSLAGSKWRYQKWRAVAEREKLTAMKAEESKRAAEHKMNLEKIKLESSTRREANDEVLRMEAIRHTQAMELEGAKASAARERLKENRSAVELGPNEDVKAQRDHEKEIEQAKKLEKETQRKHEWELHTARLSDAENRAKSSTQENTQQIRNDLLWRLAQFVLGAATLAVVYDWENKKFAERSNIRAAEAAKLKQIQEADESKQKLGYKADLEQTKSRHDAEVEV